VGNADFTREPRSPVRTVQDISFAGLYSPYIQLAKIMRTLQPAEKRFALKGHDFSRVINAAKSTWALAPEGCFSEFSLRASSTFAVILFLLLAVPPLHAQEPAVAPAAPQAAAPQASPIAPIAIVKLDDKNPDTAAKVTGALEVTSNKAIIAASGTVTSGSQTTEVLLPHRGVLRVCASTTVKLAADTGVPVGETPGLMMAVDHGAVEMSFATGRNSDILLTPDFRILIGAPGAADVKVRIGPHGDTCVDNAGVNAPYVLVTSVFDGGDYRVQPSQRVMFEHGSLREVVDNEKEPCGCPPPLHPGTNEFPAAQSAGLAPLPKPEPNTVSLTSAPPQVSEPLVYKSADHAPQPATEAAPPEGAAATPPAPQKKPGFFSKAGRFFKRLFGAE
jgi:hypothetical protein